MSKKGMSKTIRRPLQHIYPLEVRSNLVDETKLPIQMQTVLSKVIFL